MHPVTLSERLTVSLRALGPDGARWRRELPEVLASLEADWSITLGAALDGGNTAYVAEAATLDGRQVIVKVAIPPGIEGFTAFEQELDALRIAHGDPYVELIRDDVARRSLLLERLGRPLTSLGWSTSQQLDTVAATLARGWRRPAGTDRLPSGATKAAWLARFIATTWESLDRPCQEATVERAVSYAAERVRRFDPGTAVLVHGDAHAGNLLEAPGSLNGSHHFRLIDPEGLVSEAAHDLGVALRSWNDELLGRNTAGLAIERCEQVAVSTGVDPEAIWQWAFIERVSTGLFLLHLEHTREGRAYLTVADRLATVPGPQA